eukprot:729009-Amphidinium_carterae.1
MAPLRDCACQGSDGNLCHCPGTALLSEQHEFICSALALHMSSSAKLRTSLYKFNVNTSNVT